MATKTGSGLKALRLLKEIHFSPHTFSEVCSGIEIKESHLAKFTKTQNEVEYNVFFQNVFAE